LHLGRLVRVCPFFFFIRDSLFPPGSRPPPDSYSSPDHRCYLDPALPCFFCSRFAFKLWEFWVTSPPLSMFIPFPSILLLFFPVLVLSLIFPSPPAPWMVQRVFSCVPISFFYFPFLLSAFFVDLNYFSSSFPFVLGPPGFAFFHNPPSLSLYLLFLGPRPSPLLFFPLFPHPPKRLLVFLTFFFSIPSCTSRSA